jgi:competence protein ComEC
MDSKFFSFITASFLSLWWTVLPPILYVVLFALIACLFYKRMPIIAYFIFGSIWMASVGHWQYALQLSSAQTAKPIQVIGKVQSLVHALDNVKFILKVRQINQQPLYLPRKIRLSWHRSQWLLQQGQVLRLTVKLKGPHGLANAGTFNYQQWLFSQGLVASGYVKEDQANSLLQNAHTLRQNTLNHIMALDLPHGSWVAALTLGYRGLLTHKDWQLAQTAGIAHLIAISGLHLALVASFSYLLLGWGIGWVVSRINRFHSINVHKLALLTTALSTFLYAGLAGFGLPTIRAWVMLLLCTWYFLRYQHLATRSLLLRAVLIFVFVFPLSLYGLSFWLSFFAVLIIGFIYWLWPVKPQGFSWLFILTNLLKVQLALSLLMLPLVAWQFSYVSVVSPLVNLFAVPLVTMFIVPLCLLAVLCLPWQETWAKAGFMLADQLIGFGLAQIQHLMDYQWAYFIVKAMPAVVWLILFLGLLLLFLPKFVLSRKWALVCLLPLLSYLLPSRSQNWQVNVLDVGQGLSVLITQGQHALLYDLGASFPSGFNMVDSVILPILRAKGITKLDLVFISHWDNDHAGGLPQLLDKIPISRLLSNKDGCDHALLIFWQGLTIEGLWPDDATQHNSNNGSCVLKVSDQQDSILLTGDIDKGIEKRLVEQYADKLKSTILIAPHHGSNSASSKLFIQSVQPEHVVFSQGFMNHWRFPRPEVLARYQQYNAQRIQPLQLYSTSQRGQIIFTLDLTGQDAIEVLTFRDDIYPRWFTH